MNRIVREHYPAARLPDDLREGFAADADVRVTIEWTVTKPERSLSVTEIFARREPPFRSKEEMLEELRRQRDEWDD